MHGTVEPFDLILKRNRIARLQRAHDVGIVQPAVTALGVLALEGAQDDVLARDHESPPPRLARLGREVTLGAISHPLRNYMVAALRVRSRRRRTGPISGKPESWISRTMRSSVPSSSVRVRA